MRIRNIKMNTQIQPEGSATSRFLLDSPIGVDRFGRSSFSRTLAQALILPAKSRGLVVGIEGPWGSGKSFVINQTIAVLREADPLPVVLEFNPWTISGTDGLVEALLEQLSSAIGEASESKSLEAAKAGSSILQYLSLMRHLKFLKYVPGATAFGNLAEDLPELAEKIGDSAKEGSDALTTLTEKLSKHSLQSRRLAVEEALERFDRPIVIIIDDLDRLPKTEIRSVMQAVKAVANFTRIAYLLAYDIDVVGRALDKKKRRGIAYLEKIVQVQYPLPSPLPWRMRAFANDHFDRTLVETARELKPDEEKRWPEAMSYVIRLCRHPRDIVRICNKLRISLPSTVEELDVCDLVLFETLSICSPEVASAIRAYPEDFVGEARVNYEEFDQNFYFLTASKGFERDEAKKKEPRWQRHIPKDAPIYLVGSIQFLFGNDRHGSLRISNWDRLYRLLSLGPAEYLTEVATLKCLTANLAELAAALKNDDLSALSILNAIEAFRSELDISDIASYLKTLVSCSAERLRRGGDWRQLSTRYGDVVEQELRLNKEHIERDSQLVIEEAPLSISEHILITIASELGEWKVDVSRCVTTDKQLISDVHVYKRLLKKWLARLRKTRASSFALEPEAAAVLFRWGQLSEDYSGARKMVKDLTKSFDFLPKLMSATQLDGRVRTALGSLDLIWDRQGLIDIINASSMAKNYEQAVALLETAEVRNYFSLRTTAPHA